MNRTPPEPPALEEIESEPELEEDRTATEDDDIAIELPIEAGDPDAQTR